jgi:hypothetical protein
MQRRRGPVIYSGGSLRNGKKCNTSWCRKQTKAASFFFLLHSREYKISSQTRIEPRIADKCTSGRVQCCNGRRRFSSSRPYLLLLLLLLLLLIQEEELTENLVG